MSHKAVCTLQRECELLRRIASFQPAEIAETLVRRGGEFVSYILHEQFGIPPAEATQMAETFYAAMRNPPTCCRACRQLQQAA